MRPLYVVAVVLGVLVAAFYGWRLLRGWGGPSPAALAERALSAESAAERQQAAVDLASAGQPAVEHLRRVLGASDDGDVRAACVQGLGDLRDYDSIDVLVEALGDGTSTVRARAAQALGHQLLRRDLRFPVDGPAAARAKAQAAVRETCGQLRAAGLLEQLQAGKVLAYYYDRNTKRLFEAPEDSEALIDAPSGPFRGRPAGALASVFSCGDCGDPAQRYVGYLLAPEEVAQKHGEKIVGTPPDEEQRMVLCRPDEERWVYLRTREGDVIVTEAARRCGDKSPVPCRPGW